MDGVGAERARRHRNAQPDRPRAEDDGGLARGEFAPPRRMDADGQRLHHRADLHRHAGRQGMGEVRRHGQIFQERALVRRRGEEMDVAAEVIAARFAEGTAPARPARLDRDRLADRPFRHAVAERDDLAGALVAEHEGPRTM